MLSPSFSSFFPLKRQNMPIFFQAVVFSLNCKIRFYISQFEIFFLFFILHRHWISHTVCFASSIYCKTAANRDFSPAVRRRFFVSLFLSLQSKFASFFVHNAVFYRSSRPKNPFLSFVFIQPPVKRTQKGRPVLRPAALASGVRFLENYISLMAACAAARRAIGTRKGEQET